MTYDNDLLWQYTTEHYQSIRALAQVMQQARKFHTVIFTNNKEYAKALLKAFPNVRVEICNIPEKYGGLEINGFKPTDEALIE